MLQTGMNINPDARYGNPVNGDELKGLNWVRFVFKLSARPNAAERNDINKAFAQYDPIIRRYAEKGVKSLFVLNQETVGGSVPWQLTHNGAVTHPYSDDIAEWEAYAGRFAETAAQIASHYQAIGLGGQVAYEIWNESDIQGESSVYLKPQHMAVILRRAVSAIRQTTPNATIIFGGMASGDESIVSYLNQCKQVLGGSLPVDAVGIHPYGRYVGDPPFDGYGYGQLADPLRYYRQNLPGIPLWITEIGISAGSELGPPFYEAIATYMQNVCTFVANNHAGDVPVLIWFAWSDEMRNAGMVDRNGSPKAHIYEVFKSVRDREIL